MSENYVSLGLPLFLHYSSISTGYQDKRPSPDSQSPPATAYSDVWDRLSIALCPVQHASDSLMQNLVAVTSCNGPLSPSITSPSSESILSVTDDEGAKVWLDLEQDLILLESQKIPLDSEWFPLDQYMFKTKSSDLSAFDRTFVGSDGVQYTWQYRPDDPEGSAWMCTNDRNYLVACYAEEKQRASISRSRSPPIKKDSTHPPLTRGNLARHIQNLRHEPPKPLQKSSATKTPSLKTKLFGKIPLLSHSRPETPPPSRTEGGMLVVNDTWTHLAVELLTTLTIAQHLAFGRRPQ